MSILNIHHHKSGWFASTEKQILKVYRSQLQKTVNKQVFLFNETIMNIFSNFVLDKLVKFDDSNPTRMNDFIKNKIKWKHQIYNTYIVSQ